MYIYIRLYITAYRCCHADKRGVLQVGESPAARRFRTCFGEAGRRPMIPTWTVPMGYQWVFHGIKLDISNDWMRMEDIPFIYRYYLGMFSNPVTGICLPSVGYEDSHCAMNDQIYHYLPMTHIRVMWTYNIYIYFCKVHLKHSWNSRIISWLCLPSCLGINWSGDAPG